IEFLNAEGELEKLEKLIQLHDFEVYHFANNAWKLLSEHDKKLLDPTRSLQKQGINFVFIPKELTIQL
ncbi:MAG: hypothetical protein ACOYLT_09090, partial [Flavobacterium sp.]|uniref:hypothetical protein n=1 Tax=Flavobacterium sp. TaxID=239 RepID=UPI003BDEB718